MRQIKFRVWTGEQMEYNVVTGKFGTFYVNPMSKGDGLSERDFASLTPFNTKYHDSAPLMQYTGLIDKSGKEIYERDILNTRDGIGFVVWCDYMYMIESPGSQAQDEMINSQWNESEIIGNIYENPNLLQNA